MLYERKFEYAFMISPGLLTASTSSADHFGMSADCFVGLSIVCFKFRHKIGLDVALEAVSGAHRRKPKRAAIRVNVG
jgi:hypothetical protein